MKDDKPIKIELLAPARDKVCGIEAIRHGADAVYIGAPAHGARAAAANTIDDIRELAAFAHVYYAKVYVTVNTIIYDDELDDVRQMICDLYHAGVDAIIVQDMGIMEMDLPPIAIHASTQIDTRTADKARFLAATGFTQIVVARELGIRQIAEIAAAVDVPVEAFVHGALCVSYSGRCYASMKCFGRSANRGECAQFCRLPFTLRDADGRVVARDKHLLSLKDMDRSASLEAMLDAGVRSLKIEGRLKDVNYVKNVTAYYRMRLDEIFGRRKDYCRASSGKVTMTFVPDINKSFNRGFTDYLFDGGRKEIWSFDTPKSLGEAVGMVKTIGRDHFAADLLVPVNNGDGLCSVGADGQLCGFRVNRVEGASIYPLEMPKLSRGAKLYRNNDYRFNKTLARESAERRIMLGITLRDNAFGYTLSAVDEDGVRASVTFECAKEPAKTSQMDNIVRQLGKLGNTPFEAAGIDAGGVEGMFIPSSALSSARRRLVDAMLMARAANLRRDQGRPVKHVGMGTEHADYRENVANRLARRFYRENGCGTVDDAYELSPVKGAVLMECRHCLRYSLGYCTKSGRPMPYREPLSIVMHDGRSFRLKFDCGRCVMSVLDGQ